MVHINSPNNHSLELFGHHVRACRMCGLFVPHEERENVLAQAFLGLEEIAKSPTPYPSPGSSYYAQKNNKGEQRTSIL